MGGLQLTRIQTSGMFFAPDGIRLEKLTGGEFPAL
jgi:hypothetical protein